MVVTGRDQSRADTAAQEIGGATRGIGFDLADPHTIAGALADVGDVDHLVLAAIERDVNKVREYDIDAALRLVTLKLVGFTEVIHVLAPRLHDDSSDPLLRRARTRSALPGLDDRDDGQRRRDGLVRTLVWELAPIRVNAIHPAIVGDSPQWRDMAPERHKALVDRTPIGRLVTMAEVVGASHFLLENQAINGINLVVDGGWMCM